MNFLLDTCVLSELIKPKPSQNVVKWIAGIDESNLYISAITFGELHKGINKLPVSKKRDNIYKWVNFDLKERFANKILDIDINVAMTWGKIQAESELKGQTLPAIDGLIACTGIAHGLTIATRNTKDMRASGASLVNPWI